jgi:hypothetical protein
MGIDATKPPDATIPAGRISIWIDPQTQLIRRMDAPADGMTMEYSYGAPEIRDIYDLGVPRTATIVDARLPKPANSSRPPVFDLPPVTGLVKNPAMDATAIGDQLRQLNARDWGDLVVLECNEGKSLDHPMHREGNLLLEARQGQMSLYSEYLLSPEVALFWGRGFPTGWPTPKLADVLKELATARPLAVNVHDGTNSWESAKGPWVITLFRPTTRNTSPAQLKMAMAFWPAFDQRQYSSFGGTTNAEVMLDPARPALIVLHVTQKTGLFAGNTLPTEMHSDAYYWLDPAHDDLPVESVVRSNGFGEKTETTMHDVFLDFAQTADGRWYPSHWEYSGFRPPATAPVVDDVYREYWRQIFTTERLPPDWYGDPNARIAGGASTTRP